MKKKLLLSSEPSECEAKDICIFDDPEILKTISNKLSWQILELLGKHDMYPIEIAKKLGVHEQKVYYYMRKLTKAGVIRVVREEDKKGATAKYYQVTFPAFGVELSFGNRRISLLSASSLNEKVKRFFTPFLKDGVLDGKIVVGSPDEHDLLRPRLETDITLLT